MSSLRESRRRRTEQTIRNAAVDLAYEHGLDNVTTEMISDAANISPRTFFNYFAFKEAAFLPPAASLSGEAVDIFIASKDNLIADLVSLFLAQLSEIDFDREHFIKNHEISLKNPKLLALKLSVFDGFEEEMTTILTKRFGNNHQNVDVKHVAALIMVSVRVGLESWVTSGATLSENVSQRLSALEHIFEDL
ncbi:MAG: TetR/AcrR family transcriptional regulator [Rhizobiales bacterium]|nr:TetR/AcrR family transcriptional regulator [Hyphomicrobiales bacterium]NRB13257.1 TetR/AcrR family transcriptional regulator [Hyphomicrobiales bacterium]